MENGEQNLGRILSSNCVQSVAHIKTCHKPSPTHGLVKITESSFFSLPAMELLNGSENGDTTFGIDTVLPCYLCSSQTGQPGWRVSRGQICFHGYLLGRLKGTIGAWGSGEGEKAWGKRNPDVLNFRSRGQGARDEMVKEQLVLNINKIL